MSDSEAISADPATPLRDRKWVFKKFAISIVLGLTIYLLSYGPMVTRAIDQYGRTGPVSRAIYTPAGWLADHIGLYHDYRLFWARQSRNYPWWIQGNHRDSNDPLLPVTRRPGNSYQPPPPEQ